MVGMRVGVEQAGHRTFAERVIDQFECGSRCFDRGQRIDNDPARLALNHAHHGEVVAAHLIQAICDLKETVMGRQLRLTPQRWIDRFGRIAA